MIVILASIVLFLASLVILIAAGSLAMLACRVLLDERAFRRPERPHHDAGEEWSTGMDAWQ